MSCSVVDDKVLANVETVDSVLSGFTAGVVADVIEVWGVALLLV